MPFVNLETGLKVRMTITKIRLCFSCHFYTGTAGYVQLIVKWTPVLTHTSPYLQLKFWVISTAILNATFSCPPTGHVNFIINKFCIFVASGPNVYVHFISSRLKRANQLSSSWMKELINVLKGKGKAFPLQAWTGPWGFRRLRLQNF